MLDISNFPWAECTISENRTLYQDDSLSLKRSKRNTGNHRYEFELVTIDMDMKVGRGVKAKLSAAVDDTLTFIHPRLSYAQGIEPTLGVAAIGTNSAGSKVVNIAGSGQSWSLMAGDLIQFSNDTKVYEVAEDTLYMTGTQAVKLTFALRNSMTSGTVVTMNDVVWHLLSSGSIDVSMQANENQDMELTLVAVEKL